MKFKTKKLKLKVGLEIGGVLHRDVIVKPGTTRMLENAHAFPGADTNPQIFENALNAQMVSSADGTQFDADHFGELLLVDRKLINDAINEVNADPLDASPSATTKPA